MNDGSFLVQVERIGPQHQAGSDSLLTSFTFLKLTESLFQVWWGTHIHLPLMLSPQALAAKSLGRGLP